MHSPVATQRGAALVAPRLIPGSPLSVLDHSSHSAPVVPLPGAASPSCDAGGWGKDDFLSLSTCPPSRFSFVSDVFAPEDLELNAMISPEGY